MVKLVEAVMQRRWNWIIWHGQARVVDVAHCYRHTSER